MKVQKRADFYSSIKQYDNAIKDMDSAMSLTEPTYEDFEIRASNKDFSGKCSADDIMQELKKAKVVMSANRIGNTDKLYNNVFPNTTHFQRILRENNFKKMGSIISSCMQCLALFEHKPIGFITVGALCNKA